MPYGNTPSRGHGRRTPAYHWREQYRTSSYGGRRHTRTTERPRRFHDAEPEWAASSITGSYDAFSRRTEDDLMAAAVLLGAPVLLGVGAIALLVVGLARLFARYRRKGAAEEVRVRSALRSRRSASRHAPPTAEALLEAWERSRESASGKLLLGALLQDLEPAVDNDYRRDATGEVVGRNPGLRGWLFEHCRELAPHYKTLMRYKATADKFLRACGLSEPWTTADLLPAMPGVPGEGRLPPAPGTARNTAREILDAGGSFCALDDELWRRLGLVRMRRGPRRKAS